MFTFVESAAFERYRPAYLDEDEFAEFQQFLIRNPSAGAIVPGSGGVRKVRWSRSGMGKRGGLRVIYYVHRSPEEIWLLTLYAKANLDNVPGRILKQLLEAFRDD
ncbi:MAG: transcriptional regulator [Betaproteobacteria bacterium]|nr:transcriptional regulator [Betaproteobacteria bacterium]